MTPQPRLFVPAITPFTPDLSVDPERFVRICKTLLADGADGLAVFGTTSEATSMSVEERIDLLDALLGSGISADRLIVGTGCAALPDSVRLTADAVSKGVYSALLLPPFYYKGVSEDGLFASYARIIDGVGAPDLKLYLYHIPQMSGVPISLALIKRLVEAYPSTIAGLKDSAGDWSNTEAVIRAFPDLEVYSASEAFIPQNAEAGGAGCISASANVNARGISRLIRALGTPDEAQLAADAAHIRRLFEKLPLIPAIKATLARRFADERYALVRPPLAPLPADFAPEIERAADLCFGTAGAAENA